MHIWEGRLSPCIYFYFRIIFAPSVEEPALHISFSLIFPYAKLMSLPSTLALWNRLGKWNKISWLHLQRLDIAKQISFILPTG